jgi:hypothetical protein
MKSSIFAGSLLASLALIAAPLQSQTVSAEVVIRTGSPAGYPEARRVLVQRHAPRVIMIERMERAHHGRHWRRHGYRQVVVYYVGGRYYDQHPRRRSRVQEIIVYERGGRYYRMDHHRPYRAYDRHGDRDRHRTDWSD